jgi:hypothetical protein
MSGVTAIIEGRDGERETSARSGKSLGDIYELAARFYHHERRGDRYTK